MFERVPLLNLKKNDIPQYISVADIAFQDLKTFYPAFVRHLDKLDAPEIKRLKAEFKRLLDNFHAQVLESALTELRQNYNKNRDFPDALVIADECRKILRQTCSTPSTIKFRSKYADEHAAAIEAGDWRKMQMLSRKMSNEEVRRKNGY